MNTIRINRYIFGFFSALLLFVGTPVYAADRISTSSTSGTVVEEHESIEITVSLDEPIIGSPATVTVPVAVSDSSEVTVSPSSLEWSSGDWATPQTLTITAVDDSDADGDVESTIILGAAVSGSEYYSGYDPSDITITTTDNEFTVTKSTDTADGTCDADCSLREAIIATNAKAGPDRILLSADTTYTLSISGTGEDSAATGDLDFTDSDTTEILGEDQDTTIIDADSIDRVFDVTSDASVELSYLTLQGGSVSGNGAGINQGSNSTLYLERVTVNDNTSTGSNFGGGISCQNGTMLYIVRSVISENTGHYGGGLSVNSCDMNMYWSDVNDNTGGTHAGGVYISKATAGEIDISDTQIDGNTATTYGGGIVIYGTGGSTKTNLTAVTISNNEITGASGRGGGAHLEGRIAMTNVTVYGNTSANKGGGLSIYDYTGADITIAHTTVAGNTAANDGGGIYKDANGGDSVEDIRNSIVSDNTSTNLISEDVAVDTGETLGSGDYNLIGDSTGSQSSFGETNDQTDIEVGVDTVTGLSDRGGEVDTVPLESDSLAIDYIPSASCLNAADESLGGDARNQSRPQNTDCDAGSYEYDQTVPTISILSPTDDAADVTVSDNIVISFSENIYADTGDITLYKKHNDEVVQTFDVTTDISGSGTSQITLNPSSHLGALLEYYIKIDATAFNDQEGNDFSGIVDKTTWSFTTAGTASVTVGDLSGATTEDDNGTATFTVVLGTEPTENVSIGLSSSDTTEATLSTSTLLFTSENWDDTQTVTVTGVNDDIDDGDIDYTIVTANTISDDSNYSELEISDISGTNTDDDTAGVTKAEPIAVVEEDGFVDRSTFVLESEPMSDVIITPTSTGNEVEFDVGSLTFTSENWDQSQSFTISGRDDSIDEESPETDTISFAVSSDDSVYDAYEVTDTTATVFDNDTAGVTVGTISGSTTELGTSATFTVVLDSEPTSSVSIEWSSGDTSEAIIDDAVENSYTTIFLPEVWDTPQTVTVTGVDDLTDDGNIAFSIVSADASSEDAKYDEITVSDVSVTNVDNDLGTVTVGAISGDVTEENEDTAAFTVVLDVAPTDDVTFAISSDDTTEGTVSPSTLTFTSENWDDAQTVTITGVDDDVDDGDTDFSIVIGAAVSDDSNFNTRDPNDVTVTNIDDDTAIATVNPGQLQVTEDGIDDGLYISISTQPTEDVVFNFTVAGGEVELAESSMTFTSENWDEGQSIIVTAIDDDIAEGEHFETINFSVSSDDPVYGAFSPYYRGVTITDNDIAGLTMSESTITTDEDGSTDTFTVVLDTEPTADVTVNITSSDTGEFTISPSSLTFTAANWDTPQTVTVTGVNDTLRDGNQTVSAQFAVSSEDEEYDELSVTAVGVTNEDNNTGTVVVSDVVGSVTEAGGTATFTIWPQEMPDADIFLEVDMDISVSDSAKVAVSPSTITWTSTVWNGPQTVTLTGLDNDIDDGDQTVTVQLGEISDSGAENYDGYDAEDFTITVSDDDTAGITVSEETLAVTEGGAADTFTVVLDSEPIEDVVLGLTRSNTEVEVSPSTLTFTSENWDTAQTVTVTATDDTTVESAETSVLTITVNSEDDNYDDFELDTVTATITDDDTEESVDDSEDNSGDSQSPVNDIDSGDGDASGDSEETIGKAIARTRLDNGMVEIDYEDGSSKIFKIFNIKGKPKAVLHTNGDIIIAITKKYMRTYNAYTGERIDQVQLFKNKQASTKMSRFDIYKKKPGQNNVIVLGRYKSSQKKKVNMRSFVVKNGGKISRQNIQRVNLENKTAFSALSVSKNRYFGKKAIIRLKRKRNILLNHRYRVTKKKGKILLVD